MGEERRAFYVVRKGDVIGVYTNLADCQAQAGHSIEGLWKTKHQNMADLCGVAKELENKFVSFRIEHVMREFNAEADAQANKALNLLDGETEVHRAR